MSVLNLNGGIGFFIVRVEVKKDGDVVEMQMFVDELFFDCLVLVKY